LCCATRQSGAKTLTSYNGIARTQLAHRFRHLSDADLVTRRVVIQAIKPAHDI